MQKVIVIAARELATTTSGVPRMVRKAVEELCAGGYQVYVIAERIDTVAFQSLGAVPKKTIPSLIRGYFRRRFFSFQVSLLARRVKANLVIGHGDVLQQDILYIHNCVHLANQLIHNSPLPANNDVGRMHAQALSAQRFSMLVCNSLLTRKELTQRFAIPEKKSCVIYPQVNSEQFSLVKKQQLRQPMRVEFGVTEDEILIGMIVSGNFAKRNLTFFLDLFAYLDNNQLKALVVGRNLDRRYRQQATLLGINDRVIFAPPIQAVERYYAALDIFVLPAFIEEFGLSVVESMACGNCVILSDMVGAGELLLPEHNAIVADMSLQAYAQAIMPLLSDAKTREDIGQANAQIASNYQSPNTLLELVEKLLANRQQSN